MRYDYKILDRQTLDDKVNEILECRNLDIQSFMVDSEVLYSSVYDFMYKVIDIKIVKHFGKLYTINCVDEDKWIEPLLIQLNDDGSLMDYFFLEFVKTTEIDLSDYFINYIDFSEIMESVRIKNAIDSKKTSGLDLLEENDNLEDEDERIKKSDFWS